MQAEQEPRSVRDGAPLDDRVARAARLDWECGAGDKEHAVQIEGVDAMVIGVAMIGGAFHTDNFLDDVQRFVPN